MKIIKRLTTFAVMAALPLLAFSFASCDNDNGVGDDLQNAAEDTGDAIQNGVENAGDAVQDAGNKVEDATDGGH